VERASAALTGVASALDRLITAMGVIPSVFRHRTGLGGSREAEGGPIPDGDLVELERNSQCAWGESDWCIYMVGEKKRGIGCPRRLLIGQTYIW